MEIFNNYILDFITSYSFFWKGRKKNNPVQDKSQIFKGFRFLSNSFHKNTNYSILLLFAEN